MDSDFHELEGKKEDAGIKGWKSKKSQIVCNKQFPSHTTCTLFKG